MDAVSYAHSAKQAQRIEKFIENPDSTSGIVTVPKTIASGETVTIPSGRVAVLPNVIVDGDLVVEAGGEIFVPAGANFSDLEGQIALKADTSYVNNKYSGFKNYIINGNFDIWQRGTSQTSSEYGSDDRWYNGNFGSSKTHSLQLCSDTERALFNASYFSRTVVTSVAGANNYCIKNQSIENVTKLAGKTVTLSFWAKADLAKNIAIEFGQTFGTGGSPSSTLNGAVTQLIALTTTWQKFTRTITIPSIAGKTLGTDGVHTTFTFVNFWFDAGSSFNSRSANLGQQSGTFDIAQVQLEEGSVATPFEQRPIGLELSLCQRYYEINNSLDYSGVWWSGYVNPGAPYYASVKFKIRKRALPTMTKLQEEALRITNVSIDSANEDGIRVSADGLEAGTGYFRLGWSASAEL